MECINLLEILGFKQQEDVISESEGLQVVMALPQNDVKENIKRITTVSIIIQELEKSQNIKTLTNYFDSKKKSPGSHSMTPFKLPPTKNQEIQKIVNH